LTDDAPGLWVRLTFDLREEFMMIRPPIRTSASGHSPRAGEQPEHGGERGLARPQAEELGEAEHDDQQRPPAHDHVGVEETQVVEGPEHPQPQEGEPHQQPAGDPKVARSLFGPG
jgi:hypothetical protein